MGLIRRWLKAGVIEDGTWTECDERTPQKTSISTLLTNVYLHYVFDLWVHQWRRRKARGHMVVTRFADDDDGGFFTTAVDAEQLIVRPKDFQDNATPSENSLGSDALLRLAALSGETGYEDRAREWLRGMAPIMAEHPTAFAFLLGALERAALAPIEVAIVGERDDPARAALFRELAERLVPASVLVVAGPEQDGALTPLLADRALVDGHATAYVCERYACQRPVNDPKELRAQLDDALARRT